MDPPRSRVARLLPALALGGAATAWGSTFVVNKAALVEAGAFTILAVRFPVALAVLVPLALRARVPLSRLLQPRLAAFGVVLAAHFALQTSGLAYTSASRGALIVAGIPVVTALAAFLMLGERPGPRLLAGITLSVAGVVILIGAPTSGAATSGRVLGDLLVAGSVVAWALYTVQARQLGATFSALEVTVAATATATLVLLGGAVVEWREAGAVALTPGSAALMVYLGLLPSAGAFLAWNWALQHIDASRAGPFVNLVPVTGVLFAVLFGESLSMIELGGAAVIGAGLVLAYARHPTIPA